MPFIGRGGSSPPSDTQSAGCGPNKRTFPLVLSTVAHRELSPRCSDDISPHRATSTGSWAWTRWPQRPYAQMTSAPPSCTLTGPGASPMRPCSTRSAGRSAPRWCSAAPRPGPAGVPTVADAGRHGPRLRRPGDRCPGGQAEPATPDPSRSERRAPVSAVRCNPQWWRQPGVGHPHRAVDGRIRCAR